MSEPLTAKQVARELKTDARVLRKFLRKRYGNVGQGNRWTIEEDELPELAGDYAKWRQANEKRPKREKAEAEAVNPPAQLLDLDDLDEEDEDLWDMEPDDFELEELEDQ